MLSGAARGILADRDYLSPGERGRAAAIKRQQAIDRHLTPDWFLLQGPNPQVLPAGMRVAVIGAGFAGLAASWYLNQCGVETTVYEASDRIGGRVQTNRSFVPGKIVEAGAELIGENHPLWGILARKFQLRLVELTDDKDYKDMNLHVQKFFGGHDLTEDQRERLERELPVVLRLIGQQASLVPETEPWRSPNASTFDHRSVAEALDRLIGARSSLVRMWLAFALGNDNCADITQQSYLGLLASVSAARMLVDPQHCDDRGMLGYWMSTETHRCAGGNDQLAECLARQRGGPERRRPDIRLSTAADRVQILPRLQQPVRIMSSRSGTSAHQQDDFDFAVLTVPPTVWSGQPGDDRDITFDPPLDPATPRALHHGPAVKFLSRYDSRFWKTARPTALAPSAKSDRLGSVWEGTDNQGTDQEPDFCLSVFSGGSLVLRESAYPAALAALYRTGRPRGQPLFVNWPTVPFIRTGYAVPTLGQVTTISRNQLIAHRQRLYFAGEQTASGFFGYMEGALQSGARAARDIVHLWARPVSGAIRIAPISTGSYPLTPGR